MPHCVCAPRLPGALGATPCRVVFPCGKERFPTLKLPQDGSPLFRFSGQSPTSLIFTRYFPTSKWGIVRPRGKPPGAFGLMMRGIDAGTMPHFARGWFPTWQVWTDSSPLRSGELSGSKYKVGNCPGVETWKCNAEGIFGICSLVGGWWEWAWASGWIVRKVWRGRGRGGWSCHTSDTAKRERAPSPRAAALLAHRLRL